MAKTPILTKDGLIKYDNNIKDYINAAIDRVEISGAVTLVGTLGTDGDTTELPPTYKKGEMYQVVTAGEYAGKKCEVGDFIVAVRDNRITLASLPVVPDSYNFNSYVIYQIYNPITNEYDNTIYYVATYESPYNIYKYKNEDDQYKILAFTACRKYETRNNGVTWDCTGHYESGLTEYESETINYKILYTAHPIYDGNTIAIPANPYTENSMDAFNADWAVIQGNIEDLISEGVIYIDPDEESPDIGDIESITSAKLVSYDNTTSGIEATTVQEAVDTVASISKGKNRARVFATTDDMNAWLADEANKGKAIIGDNLYIVALDVPDWWISEVLEEPDGDGRYYKIAQLETQKVDLATIESALATNSANIDTINTNLNTIDTHISTQGTSQQLIIRKIGKLVIVAFSNWITTTYENADPNAIPERFRPISATTFVVVAYHSDNDCCLCNVDINPNGRITSFLFDKTTMTRILNTTYGVHGTVAYFTN